MLVHVLRLELNIQHESADVDAEYSYRGSRQGRVEETIAHDTTAGRVASVRSRRHFPESDGLRRFNQRRPRNPSTARTNHGAPGGARASCTTRGGAVEGPGSRSAA